jgi:hypothetical protein
MVKNFLSRLKSVLKYIPADTWKIVVTMHLVMTIPIASGMYKEGHYSAGKAMLLVAVWYAIIIYPIVIIVYWRMHHGKGSK